jgi:hypothetical protein
LGAQQAAPPSTGPAAFSRNRNELRNEIAELDSLLVAKAEIRSHSGQRMNGHSPRRLYCWFILK